MLLILAYIGIAMYQWDVSWFLMMDEFSPRDRLIGFISGVLLFLMDFIIYLIIDEYMVDKDG